MIILTQLNLDFDRTLKNPAKPEHALCNCVQATLSKKKKNYKMKYVVFESAIYENSKSACMHVSKAANVDFAKCHDQTPV